MKVADFDFDLPHELIAQEPSSERGGSRLLVLHRADGSIDHRMFADLPGYLRPGDLLVVNNTRVFPARLLGHREPSGGAVEFLLLSRVDSVSRERNMYAGTQPTTDTNPSSEEWFALVHPGQKLKPGSRVIFEGGGARLYGEVLARHFEGRRTVRLWTDHVSVGETIERIGHIPLPPYIVRDDTAEDRERYQTVFARHRGSIAAPTAGLHFTDAMFDALAAQGVERADVTLHVGYGTFKPVKVEEVEAHVVDPESFEVSEEAADALTRALRERRRIVAVGTTTTRVLESLTIENGLVLPETGETKAFIHPGHRFQLVNALVTNFHLPRSSLLMLVSALAGRGAVLAAYREAVAQRYRFYSYGDAMLVT